MTKAPQAVADPDDATPGEAPPAVATSTEDPADATSPKKKRGRPAGSVNAEKPTKGLLGEVEVRLQIKSKTAEGTYDFDRQGHREGEVSDCTKQLIGGWFEAWKDAVHPRK